MTDWRPIAGYEGRYEASEDGRVRSVIRGQPLVLRPGLDRYGYQLVALHQGGAQSTRKVHVLVAAAFHGERPAGLDVMHLDGDALNNRAANLAYGTRSQNLRDAVAHGTNFWASKTHCPHGHEYSPSNTLLWRNGTHRVCRTCHTARRRARRARGLR